MIEHKGPWKESDGQLNNSFSSIINTVDSTVTSDLDCRKRYYLVLKTRYYLLFDFFLKKLVDIIFGLKRPDEFSICWGGGFWNYFTCGEISSLFNIQMYLSIYAVLSQYSISTGLAEKKNKLLQWALGFGKFSWFNCSLSTCRQKKMQWFGW